MFIPDKSGDAGITKSGAADPQLLTPDTVKDFVSINPGLNKHYQNDERPSGGQQLVLYSAKATPAGRTTLYKLQDLTCFLTNIFGPNCFLTADGRIPPIIQHTISHLTNPLPIMPLLKQEARISHEWYEGLLWERFRHFRDARRRRIRAWSGFFNGFVFVGASYETSFMVVKNSWESPIKVYSESTGRTWVLHQLHHHLHEIYTPEVPMTLRRWLELMVFGRTLELPGLMELARDRQGYCIGFFWRDITGRRRYYRNTNITAGRRQGERISVL